VQLEECFRGAAGASGVDSSGESALTVLNETIRQAQPDSMYNRTTGNMDAEDLRMKAASRRPRLVCSTLEIACSAELATLKPTLFGGSS
jgi:hypothetical protein